MASTVAVSPYIAVGAELSTLSLAMVQSTGERGEETVAAMYWLVNILEGNDLTRGLGNWSDYVRDGVIMT